MSDEAAQPPAGDTRSLGPLASAWRLLVPRGVAPGAELSPAAVHWLVPGGLAIGLVYAGLYRASWRVFGEVADVRLVPAMAVWLVDVSLLGLAAVLGMARTADRWTLASAGAGDGRLVRSLGTAAIVTLGVVLIVKLVLWAAIPKGIAGWPADWRRYFNVLYPAPVYRPLILAPMWGRWALILAASVGRTAPGEGTHLAGLSRARSPLVVLGWFVVNLLVTAVYCGRQGRWMIGCMIALAVLGVGFLFAVASARRFSGHTQSSVYATGLVAEVTFLVFYLAASQRIY